MTQDQAPERDPDQTEQTAVAGPGRPASTSWPSRVVPVVVVGVLVVALLASVAVGYWSFTRLRAADQESDARADVARAAEKFTVAVNNYDSETVDKYQATVGKLLSTKFRGEFEKAMTDIVTQVREAQMTSDGTVHASGVASLDDDSARVLVVADADVKTVYDDRQRHFRWEVSLVKVRGDWLVDDFSPVA